MALEFICSRTFEPNNKIVLPRSANTYTINLSKKEISFYHSNPGNAKKLSTWKIPSKAREIEFELQSDRNWCYVIIPRFYSNNGNILKIGNR